MRRLLVGIAVLVALGAPASAHAQVVITGPTWFAKDGGQWNYKATGSIPVDPSFDPDQSAAGPWTFANPQEAQGLVDPNIPFWMARPQTFSRASTAMAGSALFVVSRVDNNNFTVFSLNFAGEYLEGEYYSCGPTAFVKNVIGGGGGVYYGEGAIRMKRNGEGPITAPPAPPELFGFFGIASGESPLCQTARDNTALWTASTPTAPDDQRRTTRTEASCNRGPNPGDPFTCTAVVGDSDQRPTASTPSGTVRWESTKDGGSFNSNTCTLAVSATPAISTCTVTYVNPTVGAGDAVPVDAGYLGSPTHKGSKASVKPAVPEPKTPGPGDTPIVCGPAPLPSCEGLVPPPNPVITCVGNVTVTCPGPPSTAGIVPPAPVLVCVGNVGGACEGFATGARLAGIWDGQGKDSEVEVACSKKDKEKKGADCKTKVKVTADEKELVALYDKLFKRELALRNAIDVLVRREKKPYGNKRINDVLYGTLRDLIVTFNRDFDAFNSLLDTVKKDRAKELKIAYLPLINVNERLTTWFPQLLGGDGELHVDARAPKPKLVASARRGRVIRGWKPRGRAKTKQLAVSDLSVTIPAGTSKKLKLKLSKQARLLIRAFTETGQSKLNLTATVSMTAADGSFAPTTKTGAVTVKLTKPKKRKK